MYLEDKGVDNLRNKYKKITFEDEGGVQMENYKRQLENLCDDINMDIGEFFYYLEDDSPEWGILLTVGSIIEKHVSRVIKSLNKGC